jgi:hypothetical protein
VASTNVVDKMAVHFKLTLVTCYYEVPTHLSNVLSGAPAYYVVTGQE